MREAVVDAKVAVEEMRAGVGRTDLELKAEQQRLADAERRGRLAGEIQDQETVTVAERFAAKHRERVAVLERKLAAQQDELALADRELADMQAQLKQAQLGGGMAGSGRSSTEQERADLQAAGGDRPRGALQDELLKSEMDRARREAAADRQLEELKKKMRKE